MARPAVNHENKKKELLAVAEMLFLDKGYELTSIDDILKQSGISKGGFYHYFKSKDEVLSESINSLIDEVLAILQKVVDDEKLGALDKFKLFLTEKSKFQSSKKEYAKLLGALMQTDVAQFIYYVTISRKMVPPLAQIIRQGKCEGIFDVEFPEETADILTRIISSVVQSATYFEYLNDAEKHKRYVSSVETVISRTLGLKEKIKLY